MNTTLQKALLAAFGLLALIGPGATVAEAQSTDGGSDAVYINCSHLGPDLVLATHTLGPSFGTCGTGTVLNIYGVPIPVGGSGAACPEWVSVVPPHHRVIFMPGSNVKDGKDVQPYKERYDCKSCDWFGFGVFTCCRNQGREDFGPGFPTKLGEACSVASPDRQDPSEIG